MNFHVVYLSYEDGPAGKSYVGKHSSVSPYDDYLGSYYDGKFDPVGKIILEYARTEEGALKAESRWQQVLNVRDDPHYANTAYGPEWRDRLSSSLKGPNNPMFGKTSELNPFYGKTHDEETRAILSAQAQQRAKDPEWLKKVDKTGKKESEQSRANKRLANRCKWWHNPETEEVRRSLVSPGEEWRRGKGKKSNGFWWVNSSGETKQSFEKPGEDWKRGRTWRNG
jgi:hypothetical protein